MRALVSIAFVASIVGGSAAFSNRSLQGQSSAPLPSAPTSESQSPAPTPGTNSQPSGPGAAQSTPPIKTAGSQAASPATPITILKVTTRLVLVDVTVTDHSGKPVNDLKKEDFEVRESGKPQKIVGFAFQPPPSANSTAAKPPQLAPGVYTNIRTLNGESGPPTILLIDALNTTFRDQAYLRQQLVKYLEHIKPRRNVAIYTLGTHLRMIQDFTSDPELLHEALKKITTQSSMFNGEQESLEDDFPGLDPNSSDQAVAQMAQRLNEFEAEQQTYQRDLQVRLTMDAMEQLARNVSGFGGRKNLVWLSGAFPLTVFPDETLQNPFSAQSNYGDDLRRIAALFSANQIAVYPVDARGLVGSLMPDASQRATSMAGMRGGPNAMRTLQRSSANLSSSHETMNELASQTGGRAFYNRNDIDHAIALSVDAGSTYYTLAYYPEDKQMNGKFRKIDVSIDRKGLQTHYRRGYFASEGTAKDNKVAQMEFGRALAPDTPIATALPFLARVTPPDKDHKQVTIDFSVVPSHILFQTQDGLQHAQMNFVTCVYDLKGKQVGKPQSDVLSTELKPETYADVMKRGLRFQQSLTLPPGKYVLKLGVRDQQSNLIGTLATRLEATE